uniref:Uncharacterized protein n=1 Tax=Anopheles dirus TaxID=7168 RepID=A0A182NYD4_9DIPT
MGKRAPSYCRVLFPISWRIVGVKIVPVCIINCVVKYGL